MQNTQQALQELKVHWQRQHAELDAYMEKLRQWAYDRQQSDTVAFSELIPRLQDFRERLVAHFDHERELGQKLAALCGSAAHEVDTSKAPEVEATKRQSAHDSKTLLSQLDALIEPLNAHPHDQQEDWQAALHQTELLMNELERHEEQQAESLDSLCPQTD